ncbi:uncharacterized protein E0L32_011200 [Thyridium curvatum]|uniref:FAD/NAD(P)-binding domain-containing protein n=1 Tax=Thyridium curvatum TaxID=1093900 RepID=A0A507BGM6_9PEZI|nr:uncharacterized protein E0L32_011200 [Thyridium curvatum]TPX19127.1 hypothetical protein E0L32_011200 [Thyridium curvatum]
MESLQRGLMYTRLVAYGVSLYLSILRRSLSARISGRAAPPPLPEGASPSEPRNIVIVGAAFAGYHAARLLTSTLPKDSPYRVVVVEPNSHFNFTWVLPRFCVVDGHEHKAFIPYGGGLPGAGGKSDIGKPVKWIRDRVVSVGKKTVKLRDSGEELPYEFLIIATGSSVKDGLPSRVGSEDKASGVELLRGMQRKIRDAKKVVVVGGGAAGVELATDAADKYPDKKIVLVHSRHAVMQRFGAGLQKGAAENLKRLGVEVILEDRVVSEDEASRTVTLRSGKEIDCDCFINCTGQKPSSEILAEISPSSILPDGHIKVKPTLQVADDALPNVYACGDVAETKTPNPNSRAAMRQAEVAADNVISATRNKTPRFTYTPEWANGVIKLTLGLDRSITHWGDGKTELLMPGEEKDLALMCDGSWTALGAKPFEDTGAMATTSKAGAHAVEPAKMQDAPAHPEAPRLETTVAA